MQNQGKRWLVVGGILSIGVALFHVGIVLVGAPAYRFFGAGEQMAQLASSGSVLPAGITLFMASIFAVWGFYALSGAGILRQLPLLKVGLLVISSIYTFRGLGLLVQLWTLFHSPKSIAPQEVIFSLVSLLIGIVFSVGTVSAWQALQGNSPLRREGQPG